MKPTDANPKQHAVNALLERIPKWAASMALVLFVLLLIVSYATGRVISWSPFGLVPNKATSNAIPRGAVLAFDSDTCSKDEGWEEYVPAYGRFIRGIDKSSARIDPDGEREPGDVQDDQFGEHSHTITQQKPLVHRSHGGGTGEDLNPGSWAGHTTLTIDPSGGPETRPRNVSLLYCRKL